jgi:hypothetical protein
VVYLAVEQQQVVDFSVNNNNHNNSKECLEPLNHNNSRAVFSDNNLLLLHRALELDFLVKHHNNHNNRQVSDLDNKPNNQQHQGLEVAPYLDNLNSHSNSNQDLDLEEAKWVNQQQLLDKLVIR